jgi:hypothetical protein
MKYGMRVFENSLLRRIFGPKRNEMTGVLRTLHNVMGLRNLYPSPSIVIRMIKSKRMRWARHVAHKEEKRNAGKILVGSQKETTTRKT